MHRHNHDQKLISDARYATCSRRFMDAYHKGLNGAQAAWVSKKYHSHRTLPNTIMNELLAADSNTV